MRTTMVPRRSAGRRAAGTPRSATVRSNAGASWYSSRIIGATFLGLLVTSEVGAQQVQCGSGFICQGAGCSQAEINPNDDFTQTLAAGGQISFVITRSPNNPLLDTGICALSFSRNPGNASGSFTGLTNSPSTSGRTASLGQTAGVGHSTTVTWTATSAQTVTINIGPPTAAAAQGCDLPGDRKAFSYTAFCTAASPTLVLAKDVVNGDGQTQFTITGPAPVGTQNFTSPNGNATTAPAGPFTLTAGTQVTLTETTPLPAGWSFTQATCVDTNNNNSPVGTQGQNNITFTPQAGQAISCTFKNTRAVAANPTLLLAKEVVNGDGQTQFTITGPAPVGNQIFTSPNGNATTAAVGPFSLTAGNQVTLTESTPLPAGWSFTQATCVDTNNNNAAIGTQGQNGISFTPQAGQAISCTFKNTRSTAQQTGSITIIKNTTGGDGTFTFTSSIPTGSPSFTITTTGGTGNRLFANVTPGSYTVTEQALGGWSFGSLQCIGGGGNTTTNGATANIGLEAGENVVCTYTNARQNGSIIVKKTTIGGDGKFDFSLTGPSSKTFQLTNGGQQALSGLPTGQYTIAEVSLPNGWTLQSATCGQGTKQGNAITVDLDPNETITCTFTNFKEKDDPMENVTRAFVYRRVDNLLTHGPDRARMLSRLEEQQAEPSLKDGPLKLSGEPGLMSSRSGMLGADSTRLGQPGLVLRGLDEPELGLSEWEKYQREEVGRLGAFSALGASTNFATDFRFSASLSDLRAKAIAAEERSAQKKLDEAGLGYYASPYTPSRTSLRPGLDIWTEGHLSFYEDGTGGLTRDGQFSIVYVGADYPLSTRVLFGALAQFDWTKEKVKDPALSGDVGGNGWMAGPYIGVRLAPQLLFDARIAWGTSQNDITLTDSLAGTRSGSFDTTRWLASATLSGNYTHGPWRLTPQAGLAYGNESYDAFKNSLGQIVDGSDISIGRFTAGSELGYRIMLHDGSLMEPYVGVTGIWNFHSDDLVIDGVLVTPNRTRAKLEGGVLLRSPSGPSVRAAASFDGIGDSDFSAVTGKVWVSVPFN
jgi:outer membrane autotransporter protein